MRTQGKIRIGAGAQHVVVLDQRRPKSCRPATRQTVAGGALQRPSWPSGGLQRRTHGRPTAPNHSRSIRCRSSRASTTGRSTPPRVGVPRTGGARCTQPEHAGRAQLPHARRRTAGSEGTPESSGTSKSRRRPLAPRRSTSRAAAPDGEAHPDVGPAQPEVAAVRSKAPGFVATAEGEPRVRRHVQRPRDVEL